MKTLVKVMILGLALFLVGCVHPRGHISSGIYDVSVSANIPVYSYGTQYDHDVYIHEPVVHKYHNYTHYNYKPRRRHYDKHYKKHDGYDRHSRPHKAKRFSSYKGYKPRNDRHERKPQHYAKRGSVDYSSGSSREYKKHSRGSSTRKSGTTRNRGKTREGKGGRRKFDRNR
ncbi:MAG: hypothetical protein KAT04_15230 [Methylococcales bacterium]|nr:hypothetical protein [Methylococcales bacterium]